MHTPHHRHAIATLLLLTAIALPGCIFLGSDGPAAVGEPCDEDAGCLGANTRCIEAICVDTLIDATHCGGEGISCPTSQGSSCVSGLCTCGQRDASTTDAARFTTIERGDRNVLTWPEAQLAAYPGLSTTTTALSSPHFVVAYASTPQTLTLVTADGFGQPNAQTLTLAGDPDDGEHTALSMQLLTANTSQLKLFVAWEGQVNSRATRSLYSYTIRADAAAPSGLAVTRDELGDGSPLVWAQSPELIDFGVTALPQRWQESESGEVIVLSYASAAPLLSGRAAALDVAAYTLRGDRPEIAARAETVRIGTIYQIARGIPTTARATLDTAGRMTRLDVLITGLDDTWHGQGGKPGAPVGLTRSFYNARAFQATVNPDNGKLSSLTSASPKAATVGATMTLDVDAVSALRGNLSSLPANASVLPEASGASTHITWQRERRGLNDDTTACMLTTLSEGGEAGARVELTKLANNGAVYDGAHVAHAGGASLIWLEHELAALGGGSDLAAPRIAPLLSGATPSMGTPRALSERFRARRISVASSPHATGILLSGVNEVRLALLAADGSPTCK